MRRFLATLCLSCAALQAAAQDASSFDERMAALDDYIASPAVQEMMDNLLSPESFAEQVLSMLPAQVALQVSQAKIDEVAALYEREMVGIRPTVEASMREAGAETFTLAEIEAMTAFYQTPEGAAILAKTQTFMQRSLQSYMPTVVTIQNRLVPEIRRILLAPE